MLEQPMIEKLLGMRLQGMADALKAQEQDTGVRELSFIERLSSLVDQQWNWRENQALVRRLKSAILPSLRSGQIPLDDSGQSWQHRSAALRSDA
jgi:hypothetical protein